MPTIATAPAAQTLASQTLAYVSGVPFWQTALLDRPIIGATIALIAALAAAALIHRAGHPRPAAATAASGILLAIAILIAGSTIVTTEATLAQRTRELVNAIANAQPDRLRPFLAPRFVVASRGASSLDLGPDWLIAVTAGMDRAITSNDTSILSVQRQGANAALVRFRCRTIVTQQPQPVGSTWEVQWQRFEGQTPDAWMAVRLEAITVYGQDAGTGWIGWGNQYRGRP